MGMENVKQQKNYKKWIIENILSLGTALLIVFMVRSSVIEAFKIPSGSMIPTLLVGDHIFVNKFSYGFKVPFSDLLTDRPIYFYKRNPPQRGDVVVFKFPRDESLYYIKRVVAISGDTIEIQGKSLYINKKRIRSDLITGEEAQKIVKLSDEIKSHPSDLSVFREYFGDKNHTIILDRTNYITESYPMITVPADHLFVMGDNRDFSNDSRFWGFVPMKNVKGKAILVWLSYWLNFSDNQFIFRPLRTGTVIH